MAEEEKEKYREKLPKIEGLVCGHTLRLFLLMFAPLLLNAIQTDRAIFLFDNGDKNMIASMLRYAEENDPEELNRMDFRIVFMGASVDAMGKEPFCHFTDKLIHYRQLGIEETVDHTWKRDRKLERLMLDDFQVESKVWTGVSCAIFEQILQHYQKNPALEVVALRDNPSPVGDTDYFRVADQVQEAARKVAVPSKTAAQHLHNPTVVIGHPPIEEWLEEAGAVDKKAIMDKLGLHDKLPIIVYAGVYGENYEKNFQYFLDIVPEDIQVIIVPHPRYKGIVEKRLCQKFKIVEADEIKTVEAIAIADAVVTADATSTVVFQANALKKKVLYVNLNSTPVSEAFISNKLIQKPGNFLNIDLSAGEDVFELLGIPRNGAKLLWEEFKSTQSGS